MQKSQTKETIPQKKIKVDLRQAATHQKKQGDGTTEMCFNSSEA